MRIASCLILAGLFITTALQAGGDKKDDKAKKDEDRIIGTWSIVTAEKDGQKAPEQIINEFRLTFHKGGKLQVKVEGKEMEGTYTMNSEKKPKELNFNVDNKDLEGIYVFEKDNLKFCIGQAGSRPMEYSTEAGVMKMLFVLKREAN